MKLLQSRISFYDKNHKHFAGNDIALVFKTHELSQRHTTNISYLSRTKPEN